MKWTIGKEHHGMVIRDYLRQVHGFSRRILIAVKHQAEAGIFVNGSPKTVRFALSEGDELEIIFPKESRGSFMNAEPLKLQIVYEDEAVIVIDKAAHVATLPSRQHSSGTVANGLLHHYEKNNLPYTVHVVTRLDRDTSGLLLIAKDRYSHSILSQAQKDGKVTRKYRAIVEGNIKKDQGTINAPIDRKEGSIIERTVKSTGKHAITHFKVLRRFADYSLVEMELETGRTHQIRVHFSHLGHPLAGDDLYGGHMDIIGRHALHCFEIGFEHPHTKERLTFRSELPVDMEQLIAKLQENN